MKRLHCIKEKLIECVECQMEHLDKVDTKELGEAIDMIKDLSEAIYYWTITKAMKEGGNNDHDSNGLVSAHHGDGMAHDHREGKSHVIRKMYMESKESKQDKSVQMRELEKYTQELTQDVIDMIQDATPDERQYLSKKMVALANKITQLNNG